MYVPRVSPCTYQFLVFILNNGQNFSPFRSLELMLAAFVSAAPSLPSWRISHNRNQTRRRGPHQASESKVPHLFQRLQWPRKEGRISYDASPSRERRSCRAEWRSFHCQSVPGPGEPGYVGMDPLHNLVPIRNKLGWRYGTIAWLSWLWATIGRGICRLGVSGG